jgi:flagellar L-ring protein precursor FlgH
LRTFLALLALSIPSIAASQTPQELGSLFDPSAGRSPLSSRTAARKGDILTVLISEQSAAQFAADTSASKSEENEVNRTELPVLDWLKVPLLRALFDQSSTGGSSTVTGSGSTSRTSRFQARISVIVMDVRPNGTLVVEGQRFLRVNQEIQSLVISGLVRRDDVRPDNSVLSETIANFDIRAEGKGMVAERQRKGILTRILDWLL